MKACREGFIAVAALAMAASASAASITVATLGSLGQPLADVVVAAYVQGVKPTAAPGASAELGQRSRQFQPHVLVVQTGTPVLFPNFDTVRHHVYSFSAIQKFELKLYAGVPTSPLVFDKPGVATLGCNIHDQMLAFVAVVDTPYFAKSDAAGHVVLDLPPGQHRMRAWHPTMTETGVWVEQVLTVDAAGGRTSIKLPARPE